MNITILNGNPERRNQEFDRYLDLYRVKMHKTGNYVRSFVLRDMNIEDLRSAESTKPIDNPECRDDFRYILNCLDETDLLVIASPLEQGLLTGITKAVLHRLTEVLQPSYSGQSSWVAGRAVINRLPLMGMIMQKEQDTDEKDLLLNRLSGERIAANIHTVLDFCITTDTGVTEAVCKTFQSIDYNIFIEKTYTDLIAGSAYSG